jgi:hypothetical protein
MSDAFDLMPSFSDEACCIVDCIWLFLADMRPRGNSLCYLCFEGFEGFELVECTYIPSLNAHMLRNGTTAWYLPNVTLCCLVEVGVSHCC